MITTPEAKNTTLSGEDRPYVSCKVSNSEGFGTRPVRIVIGEYYQKERKKMKCLKKVENAEEFFGL